MTDDARVPAMKRVLEAFEAPSERAERARLGMLELLYISEEPFSREHDIHHFTASAVVFSSRGVLLHKHKHSGDWLQPGGHVDNEEWPADAALRECSEETGVAARHPEAGPLLLSVDVHLTVKGHVHYDLAYLLNSDGEDPQPPEGESPDVGWFEAKKATEMTDDVCRHLIVAAEAHRLR